MPAPKRVLLMVSSMRGGGSERQVLLLNQHLDRDKFAPHLYLTQAEGDFLDQVPGDTPIHSFDQCNDSGGIYFPGRQLRRQADYLRQVVREHAIDVIYDRTFHMTLIAGSVPDVRRVSTIVSPPHLAVPLVEKRFVALKRRRLASSYRRSEVVVAVSRQAANSAESYYGLTPGTVVVVKNPVDSRRLPAKDANVANDRNSTRLVCVGRMTREKGHDVLLDAMSLLHDRWPAGNERPILRLVGDGPLRGELESKATSLGLVDQVQFVGTLKDSSAEIASADALVLPSRFEGMPNVVLEAMSIGTPVIATRSGGTAELQRKEPTAFWAEPNDARSLADALAEYATRPEDATSQVAAARRLIQNEHNLESTVRQLEELLDG